MTVVITGSTGFVGKNLIHYLQGSTINYVPLTRDELGSGAFSKIDQSDSIIHLAGKAHALEKVSDPTPYYEINFEFTRRLFDAFLVSDVKKFIYVSSVKAVADQVDGVLSESDFPNPNTHYGKSKLMAEEYIRNQPLPEDKSYYILRPCMIHGPGNKGNLNLLYKLISNGIPYPLAAFENKRSFLSVENLCFVIRELLERDDIPSGVYHVADDETISTNELIRLIALASGRNPGLWKINPRFIRLLAGMGDKLKLPLTTERLNKLTENYVVDTSKLRQALGKELPVKARDGIIQTIRSFQTQSK
ncbi:NAD-dependent epimerase/dehydratase family protein [Daejeonella sp. H1SJ63]|uniref:NAD-dependent epimerase/dehydratase family protein n=1 Tax=Daejeonella sp. H1SJ63 TaxID=3034145 RepID=UPI0023EB0A70|nr:NAD-dependent epimerase/dehydratase family protein [Daejeonella sp. H1SJ63]